MLSDEFIYEFENNNISGKMTKEKYIIKNYNVDYNEIINFSNNIDLPFKERVYHRVSNIHDHVYCKNPGCDNRVKFKNSKVGYYNYCSNKCIGLDPDIIKKKEKSNIEKYGVKHASLNKDIKEKVRNIYDSRDDKYYSEVNKKRINTVKNKYGVDHISKLESFQEIRKETFKKNIDSWKESYKMTSLDRYGSEHPWGNSEIHNKTVVSSLENRVESYTSKILDKLPRDYELIEVINRKDINNRLTSKVKCPNCKNIFEINNSLLYDRTVRNKTEICTECNPISKGNSGLEIQLLNFISESYENEIISNDRSLISPYEIDIYIPKLKIAIEFNGLYWHSELNKDKDYHYKKTKMCKDIGIQLIHIWEDDFVYNGDIIRSMILNKLNKIENRVYARKCEVKEITDNKIIRKFLNDNHIQGFVGSKIKIGLFYENELVSLMTFGKLRYSMGNENDFELIRFCNKLNTSVIGGASKLFKFFNRNHKPKSIISYSDNSYSNGNLYEKLGFELEDKKVKLNYYWVIDKKREHRYNFRKSNLLKMGHNPQKSEREIMYEDVGSYRIWGCGNKKWVFNN